MSAMSDMDVTLQETYGRDYLNEEYAEVYIGLELAIATWRRRVFA